MLRTNLLTEKTPFYLNETATPRVVAVIVTWNKLREVWRCIESVMASTQPLQAIVVVDNASTDGTIPALRQEFGSALYLIVNPYNLGGSGGFYLGIVAALTYQPDYLWLLDNDVIVAPEALSHLLAVAAVEPGAGIIGSKIYFAHSPQLIWSMGARVNHRRAKTRTVGDKVTDEGQFSETLDIDYVPMCSMLVRPKVVDRIGSVDPDYFVYGDDVDFCTRAKRAGFRVLSAPESKVWHDVTLNSSRLSPFAAYYYTRNCCHNALKFTPGWHKPITTGWLLLFLLRRLLAPLKYWPGFKALAQIEQAVLTGFFDAWRGKRGKVY
jgi:hypothetical protein